METVISKSKFQTRALEIFRDVERSGKSVVITHNGMPSLRLMKYRPDPRDSLARLNGSVLRFDLPLAPVEEVWEATRDRSHVRTI